MPEPTKVTVTLPGGAAVAIHADAQNVCAVTVTADGRVTYKSRPVNTKENSKCE